MKTLWIKIKNFFKPDSKELVEIRHEVEKEFAQRVEKRSLALLNTCNKSIMDHLDRRVDSLLKARAASKDKVVKQSYNGTIKELRTVREMFNHDS